MIPEKHLEKQLSFAKLIVDVKPIGGDCMITLAGGEKHHIGCTVLAVPRPSLTGDGSESATASVINVTGHKDEFLCRMLAEAAAAKYGCTAVCTGGFHVDDITKEQIDEVMRAARELKDEL